MTFGKTFYLKAIRENADRFAEVARSDLQSSVPSCPDWSVRDLVVHLGNVCTFWSAIGASRAQTQEDATAVIESLKEEREGQDSDPAFREVKPLLSWFEERLSRLESVINGLDPDEAMWTWARASRIGGFIPRRMAQETAVHRWDVELALGTPQPIEAELAKDGIDEMMDVFFPEVVDEAEVPGNGETFHFHRTDGDGEWLVRFEADQTVVSREHAKGDMAVRGSASDLLLFLWGRDNPESQLAISGDTSLVDRYRQLVDLS